MENVRGWPALNAHAYISIALTHQALPEVPWGYELPFTSGKGAIINHKIHGHGWFVYRHEWQCLRMLDVRYGFAKADVGHSRHCHDIARFRWRVFTTLKAHVLVEFGHLSGQHAAVWGNYSHGLTCVDPAVSDSADRYSAEVIIPVQRRHQHLQGCVFVARWRGNLT